MRERVELKNVKWGGAEAGESEVYVLWKTRVTEEIVRWIVENVDESVVPADEGNGDALVYNLVHLAREGEGYRRYAYEADQDEEIASGLSEFSRSAG